jgi:CelD/BcsL family acetyltransferase involved in cellulose biosynthesis
MQTHAWMQARAGQVDGRFALRLLAIRQGTAIRALAPLMLDDDWWRELPLLFEPSDLVWDDTASLQALADALARQSRPLYLERVPQGSPTIAALRRAYARRGVVSVREAMPTPVIRLDARWRSFDTCFDADRRSDFRRAERRAQRFGSVRYELHAPESDADVARLLEEAYAVEGRSWKAEAGTALTTNVAQGRFFRQFAHAAAQEGTLRFAFLRIDDTPVATQIAAEWQRRFWLLKVSFDRGFAACSPGQLLMLHTVQHAARAGLLSYEFMGVMDDWTARWTHELRPHVEVRAIPFSAAVIGMSARRAGRLALGGLRRIAG